MRSWLAAWYPEADHDAEYQPMMRDYSGLSGDDLDLAFLQDMIPHHMVAGTRTATVGSGSFDRVISPRS